MEVIPVLDLKEGSVVWAHRGQRSAYLPLSNSKITSSYDPIVTVDAFIKNFDFNKFYIADLDAIEVKGDNFRIIEETKYRFNRHLMVDIGIKTEEDLKRQVVKSIDSLILGTESLSCLEVVDKAIQFFTPDRVIVSIDIHREKVRTNFGNFCDIQEIITEFIRRGLGNFILLKLDKVGSLEGPQDVLELISSLLNRFGHLNLYVGGGIRNIEDIILLQKLGVKGVLLGTALHRGFITKEEIKKLDR